MYESLQFPFEINTTVKSLEGKPATISRKSVTAKANASGLAVRGKGDQRPFYLNGCQWRRGLTTLNKQLFGGSDSSLNETTTYLLIFNMFYSKQYFWLELFLLKVTDFLRQV